MARAEPPHVGYCRRGVAGLAIGKPLVDALDIVERLCAQSGAAYREALCQVVESATQTRPSTSARVLRTLFAEVERILARLWYLGECARACDLSFYRGQALDQRETLFAALEEATGSRHFWGIALPGGARSDIQVAGVGAALKTLESSLDAWRQATDARGPLGRAGAGIGVISAELAEKSELAGLAASGSITVEDLRRTLLYGGYADVSDEIAWPAESAQLKGDAAERMRAAVTDLATSYAIALSCVSTVEDTTPEDQEPLGGPTAKISGEAGVEGPHGPLAVYATLGADGAITGLSLESSAEAALDALPVILEDTRLDKAPLILASLDLCLECNDQ